jgi:hypothetical protein
MAKAKASKLLSTSELVAQLTAAHNEEVNARRARIHALRTWSADVAKLAPFSEENEKHVRDAIKAGYVAKGLSDNSAKVMASQDMRFLKAYNSDAKFRTVADKQDSIAACFERPKSTDATVLQKAFRAIKKARLDNRTAALQFIADHPERALTLIENHIREVSQMSSQLKAVASRSERKAA